MLCIDLEFLQLEVGEFYYFDGGGVCEMELQLLFGQDGIVLYCDGNYGC